MSKRFVLILALAALFIAGNATATIITMKISGEGAINDSTVKVGEPVSLDIYFAKNDEERRGFTIGFQMLSDDVKKVIHIPDSGKGLNENGDIKGHNGFDDKSIWDLFGVKINPTNWDGTLGDTIGMGGFNVKTRYMPHEDPIKFVTFDMIFPEEGTVYFDSCFFPPGGVWMFVNPEDFPDWGGPYRIKVVGDDMKEK